MDSSVAIFIEPWLHHNSHDTTLELAGHSLFQAGMTATFGKCKGGGLTVYLHYSWCTITHIIGTHCTPDLEYVAVKCRLIGTVREFCSMWIIAVYIPLQAKTKVVLEDLNCLKSRQMNFNPEAAAIVGGDFNQVELKAVLPKFPKFIHFLTRDNNTLGQVLLQQISSIQG